MRRSQLHQCAPLQEVCTDCKQPVKCTGEKCFTLSFARVLAFKTNNFSCSAPIYYLFVLVSLCNATHTLQCNRSPLRLSLQTQCVWQLWQHHEDVHHPATMLYWKSHPLKPRTAAPQDFQLTGCITSLLDTRLLQSHFLTASPAQLKC